MVPCGEKRWERLNRIKDLLERVTHGGKPALNLALGGGAARGIAHIGVLKVVRELEFDVHGVAGTSIGAIIGSLYAAGYDWKEIWEVARELRWGELIKISFSGMGLANTEKLRKLLRELLEGKSFEDLDLPFKAVSVDISTAEEIVLDSGDVSQAVLASAAIPGIFEPVKLAGRVLVDGGVSNNIPADIARSFGNGKVVGVDLNAQATEREEPQNLVDITLKTFAVLMWNTSNRGRQESDILIQPDIDGFRYYDLSRAEELFRRGEEAARRLLEPIARG